MSAGTRVQARVDVGDWMPRVTLPLASGGIFDSWDANRSGDIRIYWLGSPPVGLTDADVAVLAATEAVLYIVRDAPVAVAPAECLVDRDKEFAAVFGVASSGAAIVVDPADRVAAILPDPSIEAVLIEIERLREPSAPVLVVPRAPVLMLERVVEPALCYDLVDYWRASGKSANQVGSAAGNVINADIKRRLDVEVEEPGLLARLRNDIGRRVVPAILKAFQIGIMVIEAPIVGCYDAEEGGRFGRHRDNASRLSAHRQFALSINLNPDTEYRGGEIRFPEFGRELYRPPAGAGLVFSTSLLHEVTPVQQGRRFGVFTFLSSRAPNLRQG